VFASYGVVFTKLHLLGLIPRVFFGHVIITGTRRALELDKDSRWLRHSFAPTEKTLNYEWRKIQFGTGLSSGGALFPGLNVSTGKFNSLRIEMGF